MAHHRRVSGFGRALGHAIALDVTDEGQRDAAVAEAIDRFERNPERLEADDLPLRLVLGTQAFGNNERRLTAVGDELERWRSLGSATASDDA